MQNDGLVAIRPDVERVSCGCERAQSQAGDAIVGGAVGAEGAADLRSQLPAFGVDAKRNRAVRDLGHDVDVLRIAREYEGRDDIPARSSVHGGTGARVVEGRRRGVELVIAGVIDDQRIEAGVV